MERGSRVEVAMADLEASQQSQINRIIRTVSSVACGLFLAFLLQKMVWYYHILPRYPFFPSVFFLVLFLIVYYYIDRRIMQGGKHEA